ncbi:unnamed protein product [Mytilus coruscus]|uniref:Uncharacterized protein n=1 Tax=Mytilus coruscus TaxID=42192 RepID=A0A6J8E672_MYTCO|nr:unnamed protein product [Mytilus coruscus]
MEPEIEALCKQMSKDCFKRLLEDMQGMQEEWLDPEVDISNQNNTNMASYSEVLSNTNTNTNQNKTVGADNVTGESSDPIDYIKPIFLTDTDVFGSVKPPRPLWLTNIEIYNAIDTKIPAERIKGIQRIRDMWRIYMDNEEDKLSLLVTGMNLRGRQVPRHSQNPRNPGNIQPDTIRITSTEQSEKLKPKTNVANKPKGRNPKTTDANSNNANKPNSTKPGKGKVSVNETNSSNSDKGQSYIDKFMNTPQSQRRNLSQHHTPPTPPENLHDRATAINLSSSSDTASVGVDFTFSCVSNAKVIVFARDGKTVCVIPGAYPNGTCNFFGEYNKDYTYRCNNSTGVYNLTISSSFDIDTLHGSNWQCSEPNTPTNLKVIQLYVNGESDISFSKS